MNENQLQQPQPCPSCGHCPTCGRGAFRLVPHSPVYPGGTALPWHVGPVWYYDPTQIHFNVNVGNVAAGVGNGTYFMTVQA